MSEPMVFYRNKKGRRLISYLEKKLSRKKWGDLGWSRSYENIDGSTVVKIWNDDIPGLSEATPLCLSESRPNIITASSTGVYSSIVELVIGYPESILIEYVR